MMIILNLYRLYTERFLLSVKSFIESIIIISLSYIPNAVIAAPVITGDLSLII